MVKIKFQWFFDVATAADTMQIINVSAGGKRVFQRLRPFFSSYKYFKYGKVQLKLVPASTLPVDPTGLSIETGDTTVDPRDQLNPGLTRITNGEDIFDDLTGVSADDQRKIYYHMMLDTRWYKWSLQSGLFRSAKPLYWQIGQLHQDYFPGSVINIPNVAIQNGSPRTTMTRNVNLNSYEQTLMHATRNYSDPHGLFQTGHKGRLSWMPTDALIHVESYNGTSGVSSDTPTVNAIPEIDVFKIILPPAYKTKYYYRAYVTEEVFFSQPIVTGFDADNGSFRALDRFIDQAGYGVLPIVSDSLGYPKPVPQNDGGGSS